jgi:hypothetical protein
VFEVDEMLRCFRRKRARSQLARNTGRSSSLKERGGNLTQARLSFELALNLHKPMTVRLRSRGERARPRSYDLLRYNQIVMGAKESIPSFARGRVYCSLHSQNTMVFASRRTETSLHSRNAIVFASRWRECSLCFARKGKK